MKVSGRGRPFRDETPAQARRSPSRAAQRVKKEAGNRSMQAGFRAQICRINRRSCALRLAGVCGYSDAIRRCAAARGSAAGTLARRRRSRNAELRNHGGCGEIDRGAAWLAASRAGARLRSVPTAPSTGRWTSSTPATVVMDYIHWFSWYTLIIVTLIVDLGRSRCSRWCAWRYQRARQSGARRASPTTR